jgi:adenine-specific DNA methylase
MSEKLSKTARAAQSAVERGQQASKKKEVRTVEDAIRDIRNNRAGGLFHSNMNDIDMLLAEYDAALAQIETLRKIAAEMSAATERRIVELKDELRVATETVAPFEATHTNGEIPVTTQPSLLSENAAQPAPTTEG